MSGPVFNLLDSAGWKELVNTLIPQALLLMSIFPENPYSPVKKNILRLQEDNSIFTFGGMTLRKGSLYSRGNRAIPADLNVLDGL